MQSGEGANVHVNLSNFKRDSVKTLVKVIEKNNESSRSNENLVCRTGGR
jgi:hypothetical protein